MNGPKATKRVMITEAVMKTSEVAVIIGRAARTTRRC